MSTTTVPMATKLAEYGDLPWGAADHKVISRDYARSCKNKPLYLYCQRVYGNLTWQDGHLPWWAWTRKITWPFDHIVLQDHVTNWNYYISTTVVPMVTKLGRMVTYLELLLTIKLFNGLITWSCKVTWHTKTIISPLLECLWSPKLAEWWLTLRGKSHMILWSRGLLRSRDKLKLLYLQYHPAYGHQTW